MVAFSSTDAAHDCHACFDTTASVQAALGLVVAAVTLEGGTVVLAGSHVVRGHVLQVSVRFAGFHCAVTQ